MIDLTLFSLLLLAGYIIVSEKFPKYTVKPIPKFMIAFIVAFTIVNEGIQIFYNIFH